GREPVDQILHVAHQRLERRAIAAARPCHQVLVGHHETLDQCTGRFVTGHKSTGREVEGSMKKLHALIPAVLISAASLAALGAPSKAEVHINQDKLTWTQPF